MLSNGSCLTGLSLSHGVDDLRVKGGGKWAAMVVVDIINRLLR